MKTYRAMLGAALLLAGCASDHEATPAHDGSAQVTGEELVGSASPRAVVLNVAGAAAPLRQATLSTKIMGSVTQVDVHEGDYVRQNQPLLRIDARELTAKTAQLEAALAEAEAVRSEAELNARRMRALFAEDAAPRAQVDAAETGLARARAGVDAVRANAAELAAVREYSLVRAPFDGMITSRMVDPGSFAAPGGPLLVIQDVSALRITATAAPEAVRGITRGQEIDATIEGLPVRATVEGVVPAAGGSLYTVNAIVPNRDNRLVVRGSATLLLPQGTRSTFVVPRAAIITRADMTGVYLQREGQQLLRWVRVGPAAGDSVEILSGVREGDVLIIPGAK